MWDVCLACCVRHRNWWGGKWHLQVTVPLSGDVTTVFWIWVSDELCELVTHECTHCQPPQQPCPCALCTPSSLHTVPHSLSLERPLGASSPSTCFVSLPSPAGKLNALGLALLYWMQISCTEKQSGLLVNTQHRTASEAILKPWVPNTSEEKATFQISSLLTKFMGVYKLFSQELLKVLIPNSLLEIKS